MVVLVALVVALVLQFINLQFKPKAQSELPKISHTEPKYHYTPRVPKVATDGETNALDQLKIPRDKAEAWLAKHNRNAASLLAVFRANGDTNCLNEAATNFPNDPQVEMTVLARNAFPEDRRKWLDLLKASSPSNSLANYLSAQDLFKTGKPDEAVQELLAASGKSQFASHAMETQLDAEEMYLACGKSPMEAVTFALSSMTEDNMPQLATIKQLDNGIGDLMKQKIDSGDTDSAINLAQMGLTIADKLNSGDSGKYAINQLVGIATESIMLRNLDQNTAYDFLGGQTPADALKELKAQKTSYNTMYKSFDAIRLAMTPEETLNYMRRAQIYGEVPAMQWLIQQHPPAVPPQ